MEQDLEQIYSVYAPELYKICLRYSSSEAEAQDILHDSFIRIFERLSQYKGKGSFEGWLKRVVVSVALNKLRTNQHKPAYHESFDEIDETDIEVHKDELPEDRQKILDAGLSHEDVLECLAKLPKKARLVFNLYVFEKKKHKEIAQILEITSNTSKTQLKRARILLHRELTKHAEMKLNKLKKYAIFAFFIKKDEFSHVDGFVEKTINHASVRPPQMDVSSITQNSQVLSHAGQTASGSGNLLSQLAGHIKAHLAGYSIATTVVVVSTTAAILYQPARSSYEKIEYITPRPYELFSPAAMDSFLNDPVRNYQIKPVSSDQAKEQPAQNDTITIIRHVKVVDSLKD